MCSSDLEFHARVFSLTGGGKKFCTGAGGLGLQSILMELLITCVCLDFEDGAHSVLGCHEESVACQQAPIV